MKRPTIGLGYAMELVVAAAVGLVLARWELARAPYGPAFPSLLASAWIRLLGGSTMIGLALAGGLGLTIEAIRGRRPSSWGLGRWVWSIAGFFLLFRLASMLAGLTVSWSLGGAGSKPLGVAALGLLERAAVHQFFGDFAWTIAAVCTTAMLARAPRDPEPDAREWAGRIFASLAVALNIAEPLLRAAGR